MTTSDRHRCRWYIDGPGRCANPQQFPGMDVPPFCAHHLTALEPWIAARATQRTSQGTEWIAWARRQAGSVERDVRMVLGGPAVTPRPRCGNTRNPGNVQ